MQEPSGIQRRDMAITNNTPGEALWIRGHPTEDNQIRSGNWNPSVKANEKKKKHIYFAGKKIENVIVGNYWRCHRVRDIIVLWFAYT